MPSAYNRYVTVYINNKQVGGTTIKQINADYRKLAATIAKDLTPGTKQYNDEMRKLRGMRAVIDEHNRQIRATGGLWRQIKGEISKYKGVLAGLGITALIAGISRMVKGAAELEDALADVRKTTGLSDQAVRELSSSLGKLNTRTSRKELLALARDAGKLGITGKKNILEFVEAADQIHVALGEDLGEDAIKSIGKLNQQFKITDIHGYKDGMLKTGSAINSLGQSSVASEQYLVDFTTRLAGVSKQMGISLEDTLGYASALDNLGLQAEMSSTAISKTMLAMYKDTADFAKIAGVSTQEFSQILATDANAAFIKFLEGLNGNNAGMSVMIQKLDDVEADGARVTSVLSSLAGNTKLLKDQQVLANKEFEKGSSLTQEFNTKNENFAASLERVGKKIIGIFTNNFIVRGIQNFVGWLDRVTGSVERQSDAMFKEQVELNVLVQRLTDANTPLEEQQRLRKQLMTDFPEFAGNLDLESASYEQIRDRLKEVNEQYQARIILQKKQEEIDEVMADLADNAIDKSDEELEVMQKLTEANLKYGMGLDLTGKSIEEQIDLFGKAMAQQKDVSDEVLFGQMAVLKAAGGLRDFNSTIREIETANAQNELKQLNAEMDHLRQNFSATAEGPGGGWLSGWDPSWNKTFSELTQQQKDLIQEYGKANKVTIDYSDQTLKLAEAWKQAQGAGGGMKDTIVSLAKEISDLRISLIKDDQEQKLAQLASDRDFALKNLEETVALETDKAEMRKLILQKYLDDVEQVYVDQLEAEEKLRNEQLQQEYQFRKLLEDAAAATAEKKKEMVITLLDLIKTEAQVAQETFNTLKAGADQALADGMISLQQYINVIVKLQQDLADATAPPTDDRNWLNKWLDDNSQQIGVVLDGLRVFSDLQTAIHDRKLQQYEAEGKSEEFLNAKKKEFRRKDAIAIKTKALFETVINTIAAVAEALPNVILATIIGALGATQVAAIVAQPVPQAFKGGYQTVTGADDGRQYRARVRQNFYGGWVSDPSLLVGEHGTEYVVPNWTLDEPDVANAVEFIETVRTSRQMESGGYVSTSTSPTEQQPPVSTATQPIDSSSIVSAIHALHRDMLNGNIQAVLSWQLLQEAARQVEQVDKKARLG